MSKEILEFITQLKRWAEVATSAHMFLFFDLNSQSGFLFCVIDHGNINRFRKASHSSVCVWFYGIWLQTNKSINPLRLFFRGCQTVVPTFDFSSVSAFLLLVPVLTFFVYFFSMKINRKLSFQPTQSVDARQQACSNNMMDFTMPLMSVYITFIVPGAIGVYWMFKSILSTLKQFVMSRIMPLPKFTEEDFKAAEKELKGKKTADRPVTRDPNAPKPRSLHYIDADDEEPAPAPVKKQETKAEEASKETSEEAPKEGLASMIDTPALKDDKKDEA